MRGRVVVLSLEVTEGLGTPGVGLASEIEGYPPCSIARLPAGPDGAVRLRVTFAVAGFARDDLEIVLTGDELIVAGRRSDDRDRTYLHRGIAMRPFRRVFRLPECLTVASADLALGLLTIVLERPEAGVGVRPIPIRLQGHMNGESR